MGATAVAAGVDTWSPAWYLDAGSADAVLMGELATVKTARGYLLPEPIAGHRVGWNPGVAMLWAEGHPNEHGLGSPDDLVGVLAALGDSLGSAGVPVPPGQAGPRRAGFAGVRRLDSTVDLRFDSGAEGVATLAGIAGLLRGSPRLKLDTIYAPDGNALETVYLLGSKGEKKARWYDKGVESGTAQRGTWLRPEDQRRFTKETRRGVEELHAQYVKTKFQQRFAVLWQASKGVTVAGPMVLAEKLDELVEHGELTERQARNLAGHVVMQAVRSARTPKVTNWRLNRQCRELGLVLADGVMQEVEICLQDVLEEVMETPAWGGQG